VIAVDANVDLDPNHRSFSGTGHFVSTEQDAATYPADTHHRPDAVDLQRAIRPPFHLVSRAPRDLYSIYQLETPLAPGDKLNLTFKVGYQTHGFRDGNERPELAYNGMFFDSSYFPYIGYNSGIELDDPRRRREEKLGPVSDLPPRGDPWGSVNNLFTQDSDWISYRTVVSTPDDQIAFAPDTCSAIGIKTAATITPTTWVM
jgi:ABC-2 type transport system permease protein